MPAEYSPTKLKNSFYFTTFSPLNTFKYTVFKYINRDLILHLTSINKYKIDSEYKANPYNKHVQCNQIGKKN